MVDFSSDVGAANVIAAGLGVAPGGQIVALAAIDEETYTPRIGLVPADRGGRV